jgi:hypothetical protein
MSERRPRIVLGEEDFDDEPEATAAAAPAPLPPPPPALPRVERRAPTRVTADPGVPLTRPAGTASWLRDPRSAPLVAAALGVLLGWAVDELLGVADIVATSKPGSDAATGLWTALIALVFGGALIAFDRAAAGAWEAALRRAAAAALPLLAIGFAAGFVANAIYLEIVASVVRDLSFALDDARLYLARALGWAVFGAGVGAAIGLADRAPARAVNGALGGAVGGALGGVAFQYASLHVADDAALARLLGLAAIGALIAFATRAVETVRREAWLQIVAGGMRGKEFILYHDVTRIGSSPEAEVFLLKDPDVLPEHARIVAEGGRRLLTAAPGATVLVNGARTLRHALRSGDSLQFGATVAAYSERVLAPAPIQRFSTEDPWT